MKGRPAYPLAVLALTPPAGCSGVQSVFVPSGSEARQINELFWVTVGISLAITILVIVLSAVALSRNLQLRAYLANSSFVVGAGIVLPIVVLSGLLAYGLFVMQAGAARSLAAQGPHITITGKQWWWRVVYVDAQGQEVVSANELRLPVGRPVALRLETEDVIHSFWAPRLGGKLDMIPGRTNVLTVEATEPGISRAQCAEYCGGAHALMSMFVVALEPDAYQAWLSREAAPAIEPSTDLETLGQNLFMQNGCGGCHAVRGTPASGTIGPDLTHVGSRHSLAAAALPNDRTAFAAWISENQHIKPDNQMPAYRTFSPAELDAIAAYLDGLE